MWLKNIYFHTFIVPGNLPRLWKLENHVCCFQRFAAEFLNYFHHLAPYYSSEKILENEIKVSNNNG